MISVKAVSFRYPTTAPDGLPALNGIDLTIPEGAFVVLLGSNGSGKSTLGQLLNGLLRPTQGSVTVDTWTTDDPTHAWDITRQVGMIFQNPDNQLVSTTLERELAFGLENLGMPTLEIQSRVEWALERFQLRDYRLYPPHRLSGGQKQRLAIAAVVAMKPRYMVCDEPTALLDPVSRRDILSLLDSLRSEHGMGVVYITQLSGEAVNADCVIVMDEGRIVAQGKPEDILTLSEELTRRRLEAPVAVRLAVALRAQGVMVPPSVLTPDKLVEAVTSSPLWPRQATLSVGNAETAAAETEGRTIVELKNVTYTYQKGTVQAVSALKEVSLCIEAGSSVGLIGPNGSGKSTLSQLLNGLIVPGSGQVIVEGKDLAARGVDLRSIRCQVGLVFQFPEAQLFEETVFDDVAFGPKNTGVPERELKARVYAALEQVHLEPDRYVLRHPFTLSGGEKRRVALAGVLAMRPRLLALDEPTAGLDADGAQTMEAILRAFQADGGTVILISHDMDLVARMAQRVIVLDRGSVVADGPPERVFADADRLAALRLDMPVLAHILAGLRGAGMPVSLWETDLESAAEGIASSLKHN